MIGATIKFPPNQFHQHANGPLPEFEAGLRDYRLTYRKRTTRPKMHQLLNVSIPTKLFSKDCIDNADDVRVYRNFLVHDIDDEAGDATVTFDIQLAKKHLAAYTACLDAAWR